MKIGLLLFILLALFAVACGSNETYNASASGNRFNDEHESLNLEEVDYDGDEVGDLPNADLTSNSSEDETLEILEQNEDTISNLQVNTLDNIEEINGSSSAAPSNDLVETQETFEHGDISITYPQFISEDAENIQELNELIKNIALSVLDQYGEDTAGLSMDVTYELSLLTEDFISIVFEGLSFMEGAIRPNRIFYTLNIDLETMQRVRLTDVVHVDEGLANLLLSGEVPPLDPNQASVLEEIDIDRMTERLRNADPDDWAHAVFSYYTADKLVISVDLLHVQGHHALYEILYTNENIEFQDQFSGFFGI